MNWEAIGAIAELLAGVGVIATLVYLAIQIRQNTDSIKETNLRTQTDRAIQHSRFASGTPGMMAIFQNGMTDPASLSEEENWQFGTFLFSIFLDYQEVYYLHQRGRTEDFYWQLNRKNMVFYLSRPGGAQWWASQGRNMLDSKFVEYVDSEMQK
jgi:hypothetical protein